MNLIILAGIETIYKKADSNRIVLSNHDLPGEMHR